MVSRAPLYPSVSSSSPSLSGPPYLPRPHYFEKKKGRKQERKGKKERRNGGGEGKERNPRHLCHFVHKQVTMYLKKGKDLFFT